MYDVASRTTIVKSSTGENVGPSTYVICNPRTSKENCAPFLSSEEKYSSFITKCFTKAIYDTRHFRDRIPGGASLRNKAPRFVYKTDLTPGPAQYKAKPIQCSKKKLKLDPTKPKLYACAVPYSVSVVAPSIPSKSDENGYEIVDDKLVKLPPDVPIPQEINIPVTLTRLNSKKGWRWSCRSSSRFESNKHQTCGPGPAAYTLQGAKCRRDEEEERFREMARLLTFLPRFVEAQELKTAKDSRPGPGHYDVSADCFTHCSTHGKSIKPRPFLKGAPRFTPQSSDSPAPTRYNVCPCVKDKKFFSHRCAPFGFTASRFQRKKAEHTPGPASYEVKGALQEKLRQKRNKYAFCDPPFNTTSVRGMSFVARDAEFTPSAADYPEVKDADDDDDTKPISSSVFMNTVCRFSSGEKTDVIGPAQYNISRSFKKNQQRKSFNVSGIPFNTTGPRSLVPAIKVGVPCSTSYETELGLNCTGHSFDVCPRFACPEETPGPGQYNIHPRCERSMYKAVDTHNLRLKENVLRKKLRLAPRETRKHWLKVMKKTKLLKWFDVELDFQERMILLILDIFDKPV